ncbi:MAG: DUF2608 domain-containing protein [Candidatus Babeliaceae bacterium]|nr:DUF2608 domain-containing protein [Candidatus Babeliaceae bacterium]
MHKKRISRIILCLAILGLIGYISWRYYQTPRSVATTEKKEQQPAEIRHIIQINEIEEIASYVTPGPETLVIFDLDNTVIWPEEPEARDEWFAGQLSAYKKVGLTPDEAIKRFLPTHLKAHATSKIYNVDKDTPWLFTFLKENNVRVIALTARSIAFIGITKKQLKKADIKFSPGKNGWNEYYEIDGLKKPIFYTNGIIFAGGNPKGPTLELFLQKLAFKPKELIFVDDSRQHVESVAETAKKIGIEKYFCFWFTKMDTSGADKPISLQPAPTIA